MLGICLALMDEPSDREKFEHLYNTYKDMMSKLAMSILQNEDLVTSNKHFGADGCKSSALFRFILVQ